MGDIWDLTANTLDEKEKSFLARPDGLGIRTRIRSFEIENTIFIEQIETQTQTIQGLLYFAGYEHFRGFVDFVGVINSEEPLKLYYSVNDNKEKHWYKRVLITQLDKSEISVKTAVLEVRARFECLSRWRQDHSISIEIGAEGNAHVYPYYYSHTYAGSNLNVSIDNTGNLPTSCIISIEGLTDTPTFRLLQNDKVLHQARYNLLIPIGSRLVIDSNPDNQRAELITGTGDNARIENVYYAGEKDYTFTNFIQIPSGKSEFVVNALNANFGVCRLQFSAQREVI
jgi:hypothetical protein